MFLSLMLWFIFDEKKLPDFYIDGERTYSVIDVLKERYSASGSISYDEDDEISTLSIGRDSSDTSERMISQFFTEVEGPDRNWQDD